MSTTNIYGLYDPRDPHAIIWYVGKGLPKRAEHHWREFTRKGTAVNGRLRRWLESLRRDGVVPSWQILRVVSILTWEHAERKYIDLCRFINPDLCNISDGGNAIPPDASSLGGKRSFELHGNPGTPEGNIRGGRIAGRITGGKNFTREDSMRGGRIGGHITGRKNVESGHLARIGRIGGRSGARTANHNRWHAARNIVNPNCSLCLRGEKV